MPEPIKSDCTSPRPYRLRNTIQHYKWGSSNDQAFIPHLLGIQPEQDETYAELWIGAHAKAPSFLIDPEHADQRLDQWISDSPKENLKLDLPDLAPVELPYLLKVLSADQALSIQAHPTKKQALKLHKSDPSNYPDDNHKPEIAIAIDYLDALVGFITAEQFKELLLSTPELRQLLSKVDDEQISLKQATLNLLELSVVDSTKIQGCVEAIRNRLTNKDDQNEAEHLFLNLSKTYPANDPGLLFLFLLNRVHLSPGEAIFLAPGVPHAYLKGNIIECMANSDNVVRLGLTGKFCDAPALSNILDFDQGSNFSVKTSSDGYLTEYITPSEEFFVKALDLLQGETRAFSFRESLTLFLVLDGEVSFRWGGGRSSCTCVYRRGDTFVAPANLKEFTLQAKNHTKLFLVDIPNLRL